MSGHLEIDKNLSVSEIYEALIPQVESLLNPDEPLISNLSNISSALKSSFDKISWVGFYLFKENKLYLGPFQGKIACTVIEIGNGVCGTAFLKQKTIIVEDVNLFPGHIACDSNSRSEIVVPLKKNSEIFGVLDLDSHLYTSFNKSDQVYLEKICDILVEKLNFGNLSQILN